MDGWIDAVERGDGVAMVLLERDFGDGEEGGGFES